MMTTLSRPLVLTASELARVVSRLEGVSRHDAVPCEPWHVRRYLVDVKPATEDGFGRTRLYSLDEACLVRLAVRLEREGVSAWVVRAVLSNHADDLTRAWRSPAPLVLAVRGVRGKVVTERDVSTLPIGTITVSLEDVRRGVRRAVARIRRQQPSIPLFNRRVLVQDALRDSPVPTAIW